MLKIKLGDRIVNAVQVAGGDGLTRKELVEQLNAPSGSVRREVQTLMGAGAVVENGERDGSKIILAPALSVRCPNREVPTTIIEGAALRDGSQHEPITIILPPTRLRSPTDEAESEDPNHLTPTSEVVETLKEMLGRQEEMTEAAEKERDRLKAELAGVTQKLEVAIVTALVESPFEKRFWDLVNKEDDAIGCWLWNGPINIEGQGLFHVGGQGVRAKRLAVELSQGKPIEALQQVGVCKLSKLCINPEHLGVKLATHRPGEAKTEAEIEDDRQRALFPHACPSEGCVERFDRKGDLTRHYQSAHDDLATVQR